MNALGQLLFLVVICFIIFNLGIKTIFENVRDVLTKGRRSVEKVKEINRVNRPYDMVNQFVDWLDTINPDDLKHPDVRVEVISRLYAVLEYTVSAESILRTRGVTIRSGGSGIQDRVLIYRDLKVMF